MAARLLRAQLLIQLAGWAALAWLLVRWTGWPWAAALVLVLAGPLLACMLVVSFTFAYAGLLRSARPPGAILGIGEALRMWLQEVLAFFVLFCLVQPFERLWMGEDRLRRSERPVLLVHGYACNRGVWVRARRVLEGAGFCVATVNLEPPYDEIDGDVDAIARRIEEVCAATGAARVDLIAHSLGGLAARAYLARFGAARVARLVTLGTPHGGSAFARLGWGPCAREMEPGSGFLVRLNALRLPVPVTAVYSLHDNFVVPAHLQRLEGADNRPMPGVGHLRLVLSPRVLRGVADLLARPAPPQGGQSQGLSVSGLQKL